MRLSKEIGALLAIELKINEESIEDSILQKSQYKTKNQKVSELFVAYIVDGANNVIARACSSYSRNPKFKERIDASFSEYSNFILESSEEQDIHERLTNANREFYDSDHIDIWRDVIRTVFSELRSGKFSITGFSGDESLVIDNPNGWELDRKIQALRRNFKLLQPELILQELPGDLPGNSKAQAIELIEKISRKVLKAFDRDMTMSLKERTFEKLCAIFAERFAEARADSSKEESLILDTILDLSNIEYDSYKAKEWWLERNAFDLLQEGFIESAVTGCRSCEKDDYRTDPYFYKDYEKSCSEIRSAHLNILLKKLRAFRRGSLSDPLVKKQLQHSLDKLKKQANRNKASREKADRQEFGRYDNFDQGYYRGHVCPVALDKVSLLLLNEKEYLDFKTNAEINDISVENEFYLELRDYRYIADIEYSKTAKEKQLEKLSLITVDEIFNQILEFGGYYINNSKEQAEYIAKALRLVKQIYSKYESANGIDDLSTVKEIATHEFDKTRNYTPDISLIYAKKASMAFEQMSSKKVERLLTSDHTELIANLDRIDSIILISIHSLANI